MTYQTKEMRPDKQVADSRKIKIEVRSRGTGTMWSITASSPNKAQAILDSLNYVGKPVVLSKPETILIKVEVR